MRSLYNLLNEEGVKENETYKKTIIDTFIGKIEQSSDQNINFTDIDLDYLSKFVNDLNVKKFDEIILNDVIDKINIIITKKIKATHDLIGFLGYFRYLLYLLEYDFNTFINHYFRNNYIKIEDVVSEIQEYDKTDLDNTDIDMNLRFINNTDYLLELIYEQMSIHVGFNDSILLNYNDWTTQKYPNTGKSFPNNNLGGFDE